MADDPDPEFGGVQDSPVPSEPKAKRYTLTVVLTESEFNPQPGADYYSVTSPDANTHFLALSDALRAAVRRMPTP